MSRKQYIPYLTITEVEGLEVQQSIAQGDTAPVVWADVGNGLNQIPNNRGAIVSVLAYEDGAADDDDMFEDAATSEDGALIYIPEDTFTITTEKSPAAWLLHPSATLDTDQLDHGTVFRFNGLLNDYGLTAGRMWTTQTIPAKFHRFRDRVMVGAAAAYTGEPKGLGGTGSWMSDESFWGVPSSIASLEQNSIFCSVTDQGFGAVLGGTRNSDDENVGMGCIAVSGIAFNDRADATKNSYVYPGFFVGILHRDSECLGGFTHGIEANTWNQKGNLYAGSVEPYDMFPSQGIAPLWLGNGWNQTDGTTSYLASCAIGILNTPPDNTLGKYRSGIVFKSTCLDGCDGETGTGQAISMARGHRLDWYASETNGLAVPGIAASLYSSIDDAAYGVTQIFEDELVRFYNANGNEQIRLGIVAAGVNYCRITGSAAGDPIDISANGSDANIALRLVPKDSVVVLGGSTRPSDDATFTCGSLSYRWTDIFATNGTIVTSDANQKQDFSKFDDRERSVALKIKSMVKKFRFKDAVEKKGNGARIHTGICAQDVASAFKSEGLDPYKYSMFCAEEVNGKETYGIRYNELLTFMIGAM